MSTFRYRLESGGRQSKPRPHWSRYGQGRKDFEKAEEEQAEKNKYLDTLEQSRCFPYSVIESLRSFDEKELDLNLVMEIIRYSFHWYILFFAGGASYENKIEIYTAKWCLLRKFIYLRI